MYLRLQPLLQRRPPPPPSQPRNLLNFDWYHLGDCGGGGGVDAAGVGFGFGDDMQPLQLQQIVKNWLVVRLLALDVNGCRCDRSWSMLSTDGDAEAMHDANDESVVVVVVAPSTGFEHSSDDADCCGDAVAVESNSCDAIAV